MYAETKRFSNRGKNHLRVKLIFFLCIFFISASSLHAQKKVADTLSFDAELKLARTYSKQLHEFDWFGDTGVVTDAVMKKFKRLEFNFKRSFYHILHDSRSFSYSFKDFPNVYLAKSSDNKIRLFTWSYPQEGTGFDDSYSLIQYALDTVIYTKSLTSNQNSGYFSGSWKVYTLRSMSDTLLYVAIGSGSEDKSGGVHEALVIGLSKKELLLDYPAFPNHSSHLRLHQCSYTEDNGFSFNAKKKIFTIKTFECQSKDFLRDNDLYHKKDNRSDLADYGDDLITKLYFDGSKFLVLKHQHIKD
jgi:hypothetical protein